MLFRGSRYLPPNRLATVTAMPLIDPSGCSMHRPYAAPLANCFATNDQIMRDASGPFGSL